MKYYILLLLLLPALLLCINCYKTEPILQENFQPGITQCSKCGETEYQVKDSNSISPFDDDYHRWEKNCLVLTCERCDHQWAMLPIDGRRQYQR